MNDEPIVYSDIIPIGIKSVRDLAHRLGVRREILESMTKTAGAYYAPFESNNSPRPFQKKPFVKKSRDIDNPVSQLKEIQSKINVRLLRSVELPDHVFGGRKGRSVIQNAKHHLGRKVLVTIDVRQFFPSISNTDIYHIWANILGCSRKVASMLTRLTTFERHLPQGAPTSTALANLFLLSCDSPIREFCAANGITYTSWVDDLAFSGKNSRDVIGIAVKSLRRGGLKISRRKVHDMPSSGRQVLMGIIVNKRPGVTREYLQAIRSGIHKFRTNQIQYDLAKSYLRTIRGRIAYINQTNPQRASNLIHHLDELVKEI